MATPNRNGTVAISVRVPERLYQKARNFGPGTLTENLRAILEALDTPGIQAAYDPSDPAVA